MFVEAKTPCINGCIMCGFCCVSLTIDDDTFHKPAYQRCKNLIYKGNIAICAIHDERQPQTCRDFDPLKRFKFLWFDHRLRYYRQNEYMQHLIWMAAQGYLDHLPVMQALKAFDFSRASDVFKYFVKPVFSKPEGTEAARPDWFALWPGLKEYLAAMPENQFKVQVRKDKTINPVVIFKCSGIDRA